MLSGPDLTAPAVGDVNNDGFEEIAIGVADATTFNVGHIRVFRFVGVTLAVPHRRTTT